MTPNIYGKTWTWTYDNAGNITSRKEYAYTTGELGVPLDTVIYGYTDPAWGDLLTSYDGTAITYDTIGNPLYDGTWTYTWEHGRRLASMTDGTTTWSYSYNSDGLRTGRTDGTNTYQYVYTDGQLSAMYYEGTRYLFHYEGSTPVSMYIGSALYYYATNINGDVVAIFDKDGNRIVEYTYDAWGNILSISGSMADTIGAINPLRYRGYVYDQETGLYYLQSRYYNPTWGRFINADGFVATGQGFIGNNMFAYCGNNPIIRNDATGYGWSDIWNNVKNWLTGQKEKAASSSSGTCTFGITGSAAFGISGTVSLGVTFDQKGNLGLAATINGGGGFPTAGIGVFGSLSSAPNIYKQSGLGTSVGASGGPGVIAVGGDYNIMIDQEEDKVYHGGSINASVGLYPTVVEVHGEAGYTGVIGFNVFDPLIAVSDWLSKLF